ncbi:MAG: hypothetical protein M4579_003744 [Chaenotheca gracillima]|nr:MAG: hypothetical protein M4579_003744 [Chaenotheca gracillima]
MLVLNSVLVAGAALLPLVSSAAVSLEPRADVVEVSLSPAENAAVKVSLKNTGATDLHLLKYGTFLDSAPVQKAVVYKDGAEVPFQGILRRTLTTGLSKDAFTSVAAGETVEKTITLAEVHDLQASGKYDIVTQGSFPTASDDFSTISGEAVYFRSNDLSIDVDGAKAAKVEFAIKALDTRTITTSCSGSQGTALKNALSRAVTLSNAAANAATSGSASKFQEYFKTTSSSVRATVAARFRGVASQAGSTTSGSTRYYCTDPYGYCDSNTLAYTLPANNLIANCPIYYTVIPNLTGTCHAQDQTTTSIHEFTHAPATYSPGTQDLGYGYAAATSLSSNSAVNNADSYALYANAIYVGC